MKFGWQRRIFYVVRNDPLNQILWINTRDWLVSAVKSTPYSEVRGDDLEVLRQWGRADKFEPGAIYLGRTKKRWWLRLIKIIGLGDLIHPFVRFKL